MIIEKTNEELYDTEWRIAQREFPKSKYGIHESRRHTANVMLNDAIISLGKLQASSKDCTYLIYKAIRAQRIT